jgi:hypothetical protein
MKTIRNRDVAEVFRKYPPSMRKKLMDLRNLVYEAASETDGIGEVEETLKWGEPSYLVRGGSTIRIDWKERSPDQYAMYFHCQTKLVDTFRELYGDRLKFEGNRAIVFRKDDPVPQEILKHCIALSLTYHSRKHLPLLGV